MILSREFKQDGYVAAVSFDILSIWAVRGEKFKMQDVPFGVEITRDYKLRAVFNESIVDEDLFYKYYLKLQKVMNVQDYRGDLMTFGVPDRKAGEKEIEFTLEDNKSEGSMYVDLKPKTDLPN